MRLVKITLLLDNNLSYNLNLGILMTKSTLNHYNICNEKHHDMHIRIMTKKCIKIQNEINKNDEICGIKVVRWIIHHFLFFKFFKN